VLKCFCSPTKYARELKFGKNALKACTYKSCFYNLAVKIKLWVLIYFWNPVILWRHDDKLSVAAMLFILFIFKPLAIYFHFREMGLDPTRANFWPVVLLPLLIQKSFHYCQFMALIKMQYVSVMMGWGQIFWHGPDNFLPLGSGQVSHLSRSGKCPLKFQNFYL